MATCPSVEERMLVETFGDAIDVLSGETGAGLRGCV